jgi:hypothetical protein
MAMAIKLPGIVSLRLVERQTHDRRVTRTLTIDLAPSCRHWHCCSRSRRRFLVCRQPFPARCVAGAGGAVVTVPGSPGPPPAPTMSTGVGCLNYTPTTGSKPSLLDQSFQIHKPTFWVFRPRRGSRSCRRSPLQSCGASISWTLGRALRLIPSCCRPGKAISIDQAILVPT